MSDDKEKERPKLAQLLELATPADRIREMFDLVEVPISTDADGKPLAFVIKAVDLDTILMARGGLPAVIEEKEDVEKVPPEVLQERIEKWKPGAKIVARAGIMRPEITFGDEPEDGKLWWDGLPFRDQSRVVWRITALSGFGGSEENKKTGKFSDDKGGGSGGGEGGEARADAEGAAVVAP